MAQMKISPLQPTKNEREATMECSMCGDVGFAEQLFQCGKCQFRFQHKYCSKGHFHGDHIELCDWCFVESDQIGFSPNFSSRAKSKRSSGNNVDGKRSDVSASLRRVNACSAKRAGDEAEKATGWLRNSSKTDMKKSRLALERCRRRMKLLNEILC
eukprot:PITA_28391